MNLQISAIKHPAAKAMNIKLYMARADQIHPLASGNKYYKLKPLLEVAKAKNCNCLLSFGGAFSNHIHALALTAQEHGFESVGIIRGESHYADNSTLSVATKAGMKLEFVNREEYRRKDDLEYLRQLQNQYPACLIIPEGGSSQLAIGGCKALADEINRADLNLSFDYLAVASGTGATMAGLICGANENQKVIGYSVLRDQSLGARVRSFIQEEGCENNEYDIEEADFGGYAKFDKELLEFVFDWYQQTGILLDPIYTSKLCMRLVQQLEAGEFREDSSICIVHTGGLQGWLGMKQKVIKIADESQWLQLKEWLDHSSK